MSQTPLSLRALRPQRPSSVLSLLAPSTATTAAAASRLSQTRGYKQVRLRQKVQIPSATAIQPEIPKYPLGPRQVYKQSNTGLYGTARIRFGNTVSRETEVINSQKNRRKWRVNVQEKRLWSQSLGVFVRTRITARVLRTLDKVGGLDEYLLGDKGSRIAELGPWGWRLRWRVMQTPSVKERFRQQRLALGLPEEGLAAATAQAAEEPTPSEIAATQSKLDSEETFDLAPEDEFMQEEAKPTKP